MMLTFIGGFLEIYSFLLKGNVFATSITANIVLMFYHITRINLIECIKYLLPILGFSVGIVLSNKIKQYFQKKQAQQNNTHHTTGTHQPWQSYIILMEMLIVLTLYMLQSPSYQLLTICMISFMSAIQIETFGKVHHNTYMSTMCTGNTKKLIESILNKEKPQVKIFSCIILSFGVGITIGAILISYFEANSILFLTFPLLINYYLVRFKNS